MEWSYILLHVLPFKNGILIFFLGLIIFKKLGNEVQKCFYMSVLAVSQEKYKAWNMRHLVINFSLWYKIYWAYCNFILLFSYFLIVDSGDQLYIIYIH